MKVKVSEATRIQIDWMVAKAEGATNLHFDSICCWWFTLDGKDRVLSTGWSAAQNYAPSTDWALAGPIIEREGIAWRKHSKSGKWFAMLSIDLGDSTGERWTEFTFKNVPKTASTSRKCRFDGPTPLIAAMRCFVASKLGEEVEIPEEFK